jgi:hypothetical protein
MLTPHSLLGDRGCRRRRAVRGLGGRGPQLQRARDVGFVRRVLTDVRSFLWCTRLSLSVESHCLESKADGTATSFAYQCERLFTVYGPSRHLLYQARRKGTSQMAGASADVRAPHFVASDQHELPDYFNKLDAEFSVQIPISDSVRATGIVGTAFQSCHGLTSVIIPDGVTNINFFAFNSCKNLSSIALPESVTEIGYSAFSGCRSLTAVNIPRSVTVIKSSAFANSGLTAVVFPDGVVEIGEYAFVGCKSLRSVNFPAGLTKISYSIFCYCSALTTAVLPESVNEIATYAFCGCSCLTSVNLPKSVTTLGGACFRDCSWLVVVSFRSPRPISVAHDAFMSCHRLALVVAPMGSGLVGSVIQGVTVVEDTEANRRRALDLQYWRVGSHRLCSPARRHWVLTVLLVANRLRGGALTLPREMWYAILEAIQRCELGPAPR